MTKDQRKIVTMHFSKISKMDNADLIKFEKKWYIAKSDLNPKVFEWVRKGIDRARKDIMATMEQSAIAVSCDVVTVD